MISVQPCVYYNLLQLVSWRFSTLPTAKSVVCLLLQRGLVCINDVLESIFCLMSITPCPLVPLEFVDHLAGSITERPSQWQPASDYSRCINGGTELHHCHPHASVSLLYMAFTQSQTFHLPPPHSWDFQSVRESGGHLVSLQKLVYLLSCSWQIFLC